MKQTIPTLLTVLVVLPIWYWLMYQVLDRINASELMWFLYWVYVPFGLLANILANLARSDKK